MNRALFRSTCLVGAALTLTATFVQAQDDYSRVEVFGGYSIVRPNLPGNLVPGNAADSTAAERVGEFALGNVLGWGSSVTLNLNRSIGITADFNGNYKSLDLTVDGTRVDARGSLHTFLFGPTLTVRNERVRPFVDALFGAGRVSASVKVDNDSVDFN